MSIKIVVVEERTIEAEGLPYLSLLLTGFSSPTSANASDFFKIKTHRHFFTLLWCCATVGEKDVSPIHVPRNAGRNAGGSQGWMNADWYAARHTAISRKGVGLSSA